MNPLDPRTYTVTRADLVRYAGAAGDFNPIHYSDRVATSVGLPGVIAHGMYTMALAGHAVTSWLDDEEDLASFSVRFTKPVVVPDDETGTEVRVSGTARDPAEDGSIRVDLEVTCEGTKVLGMARAVVRPRA